MHFQVVFALKDHYTFNKCLITIIGGIRDRGLKLTTCSLLNILSVCTKGQLILKCLWCHRFDQNSNENIVRISALKFFVASWGLLGSFMELPGGLVTNIINTFKLFWDSCRLP